MYRQHQDGQMAILALACALVAIEPRRVARRRTDAAK